MSLTGKGPGAPLPPTLVFVAGFVLGVWIDHRLPMVMRDNGPGLFEVVCGWASIVAGCVMFAWGLGTFARARTGIMLQQDARRLVEAGPYRLSRNPMYVGFVAIYLGASLVANTAWPLVLLPVVLLTIEIAVIAREERYLRRTFGGAYDEYCQRVGRWL